MEVESNLKDVSKELEKLKKVLEDLQKPEEIKKMVEEIKNDPKIPKDSKGIPTESELSDLNTDTSKRIRNDLNKQKPPFSSNPTSTGASIRFEINKATKKTKPTFSFSTQVQRDVKPRSLNVRTFANNTSFLDKQGTSIFDTPKPASLPIKQLSAKISAYIRKEVPKLIKK